MVDDGFIRGHSALQLTAHDEFEESGITVALEDKQSFPNRVWLYDKKLCTERGSQFGDFYALAVDLSVAMPAVTAEGVVNWQSTTQVYGDFKRIQSDLKKGESGGYSALRTRRVVDGKMQGEVTVVDAEQASKVEVSEKRLAAADRFERENGIHVADAHQHMAKARRARMLGLIWGAYAEPSSHQEELLRQQAKVTAQLVR